MWLIISPLSPQYIHLFFCCVDFGFNIIRPFGIFSFVLLIVREIQFLSYGFISLATSTFSLEMSLVSRLKHP